jgi:precorrin-8X/cobalt-precorrin-8 methylmutase
MPTISSKVKKVGGQYIFPSKKPSLCGGFFYLTGRTMELDGNAKKAILLLGHGSKAAEANDTLRSIAEAVSKRGGWGIVRAAFLQIEMPGIKEAVDGIVREGVKDITVMPYFLYPGLHVTRDIPEELESARAEHPGLKIRIARNLGFDERLVDMTVERIEESLGGGAVKLPLTIHPIEKESFRIIETELRDTRFTSRELPVVRRVIHTTADFDFRELLRFTPNAINAGIGAIKRGCGIITDVRMVETGIMMYRLKPFNASVHCFSSDADVIKRAALENLTRTAASMRKAAQYLEGSIVAIGNAPTALMELLRILKANNIRPALVVGVPVGFVGAAESKDALMASGLEYISTSGRKGGSTVAAAIVNALAIEAGAAHGN